MPRPNRNRILQAASLLVLLFANECLSLPRASKLESEPTPEIVGGGPANSVESIERRASRAEMAVDISRRNQRLYPLYITRNVALLPASIVTPVLERFYDEFIRRCQENMIIGAPLGNFLEETDNKLKLIILSQGAPLTWNFLIKFATQMRERASLGWSCAYDAWLGSPPGDVVVHVGLQIVGEALDSLKIFMNHK